MIVSGSKAFDLASKIKPVKISGSVEVNWTWYDKSAGTVSWNFANDTDSTRTVILYRNSYYFGNAYWCIYVNNKMTYWAASLVPLTDSGVENNTMPIGVVDSGQAGRIIAFLFTFSKGQKWSALEGGFSVASPPANPAVYEVTPETKNEFCIGYDQSQITDWDAQTGSTMSGYAPNPSSVETVEVRTPSNALYYTLFNDTINNGKC